MMSNLQIRNSTDPSSIEIITKKIGEIFPEEKYERILLINPPMTTRNAFDSEMARARSYPCYPPYGLGLLCAGLEERGYETSLLDLNYELLRDVHENDNFGYDSWKKILQERLDSFQPDATGVTCMYTMIHPAMKEVTDFIKEHSDTPIIAGGAHPSLAATEILKNTKSIDLISTFESDDSFPDFVDYLNGKNDGKLNRLSVLEKGNLFTVDDNVNPDVEKISFRPQYHNLPVGDYTKYGKIGSFASWMIGEDTRCSTILSKRGCRANCDFCSVREFNGFGVRHRPIEDVVDEIEWLRDDYGVKHFVWLDDDLLANKKSTIELFDRMVKRNLGITWDASNGVIAASLSEEIADLADKSGCIGMIFGIESGDEDILKRMRKPASLSKFVEAAEIIKRHPNIATKGFLITGYPEETIEQTWNTIGLAREMELNWYTLQIAMPLPGTTMTEKMKGTGDVLEEDTVREASNRFMTGFGNTAARDYERQRRKVKNQNFNDFLSTKPANYVPTAEEIKDIWFVADYLINYEPIIRIGDIKVLQRKEKTLKEICLRKSSENPLGNLYLAMVRDKLGEYDLAQQNRSLARQYLEDSEFWTTRFEVLGLNDLLEKEIRPITQ